MNPERCRRHALLDWWCALCGVCIDCGRTIGWRENHGHGANALAARLEPIDG